MANTDFIQATIEIFGCIVTVVVAAIFAIITGDEKKSEKNLLFVLIASGLSLALDAGWYMFDGNTASNAVIMNRICNFAIFLCNPSMTLFLIRYLCELIKESGKKPNRVVTTIAYIFSVIPMLVTVSNLFVKWMYYFDDQNIYYRLSGWYIFTAFNSAAMITCIFLIIVHRRDISRGYRIPLYITLFAPFFGIVLQSMFLGISFIQIGIAVGSIGIVGTYLIDWVRREKAEYEVSEERKKIWLFECVFSIMILFVSAAIFSCVVSVNSVSNKNSEQNSTALAYMVSETVESTLSEPVNVSRTMAQSDIIIEALSSDNIEGTETEKRMLDFMKRIKEEYGYQMIFVAADKSKAYYTYDGFSRYMEDAKNSNDIWYYNFKKSDNEYELNIDADKDNDMSLAAFVNMEVKDENGEFIGVCGVAMSIESLMGILADYEDEYELNVYLTNKNGLVQVNTNRNTIECKHIDVPGIGEQMPDEVSYERDERKAVLTKNMSDYGWYLVIEDMNPDKLDVFRIILPSMIIYVIGVTIMLVFSLIFGIRERRRNTELHVTRLQSETAKAESDAKGRFLANMSHEIRTPINAVLGMDTMILRESREPQIKEYAMNIQNAGNTLLSLINDVLDISKIESGKMEIVPVEYDFATLIYDVMNMISIKAEAKDLEINLVIDNILPSGLLGDDVRLRQIIVNLMNNAVKYTDKGSVTLIVKGDIIDDFVRLNICVKDTGIGIKEEDLDKLSEEFVRIDESRNKSVEGTGLGMSITVKLLDLMSSKLNVSSVYGEGSEFSFVLDQTIINSNPIGDINNRIKQKASSYKYEATFIAPDAKILMVDDNDINRMVFANLLKETKVQIDEASGGRESLDLVFKNHYDIIFMDHMMPDMDGIEVMQKIKETGDHPNVNTPVIVLTANAISGAKEKYMAAGFNDYLSKPIIPELLEKMISTLLPADKVIAAERIIDENGDTNDIADIELPMIEGIDWNYAKLHFADNSSLMNTLRNFAESIDAEADKLKTIYDDILADPADSELLASFRIKVHAMKSTATLLGCVPIAGMAATLEYAAREGKTDKIKDVTPYFISSWREYRDKLSFAIIQKCDKKDITDFSLIIDYINQLKNAMLMFDVHGADSALDKLKEYSYEPETESIMVRISAAVSSLDVDTVTGLCDEILLTFNV